MKKNGLLFLASCLFMVNLFAQDINSPVGYMDALDNAHKEMDQRYMAYISECSHGNRVRKIENLRIQVLESIADTRNNILEIPPYQGDNSLRQSNLDYINICYTIFNEDYSKIVNTEEIAEQSFDEMQAYLSMKEKADEKLKNAIDKIDIASHDFAHKYKITLHQGVKTELAEKMEITNNLNKYFKPINLIFFKCHWQDNTLNKALIEGSITDMEKARIAVIKYAAEGLLELKTIQPYEGDNSLIEACSKILQTYKDITENETPAIVDYHVKSDEFDKIKKVLEAKPQPDRTKDDINTYNKAITDLNAAIDLSNQATANSNKIQNEATKAWGIAVKTFFDKYTPYYR